jgi:HPt (histidine-containing phosphotransfer) domain-containing protein
MEQQGTDSAEHREVMARLQEIGLTDEPALFAETVELFLTDALAVLDQLKEAFAAGNVLALERAAHRLKGAALNLGVSSIAQPAKALEDEARRHGFAGLLERELGEVAVFLRQAVARVAAGS